jgi:FkbM family methyltransferase
MNRKVHEFDNGVRVFDDHLMPAQRERYRKRNVHEADEEDLFIEVVQALPGNGCFVNIGTAIGYYAILARKLAPQLRVHAVEPLHMFRQFFLENIVLNDMSGDDFIVHATAVGALNGPVAFVEKGYESQLLASDESSWQKLQRNLKNVARGILGWLGVQRYAEGMGQKTVSECRTLESLLRETGGKADLVSMDVQGLEEDILRGSPGVLERADVATFLIGTHGDRLHRHCLQLLQEHGYQVEYEEADTPGQPDGIIIASKGVQRLSPR